MPDKKIFDMNDLENFELPPLPARPVKITDQPAPTAPAPAPAAEEAAKEKVRKPVPPLEDAPAAENEAVGVPAEEAAPAVDFDLPPIKKPEPKKEEAPVPEEAAGSDDFDLPPMKVPEPKKEEAPKEEYYEDTPTYDSGKSESKAEEEEKYDYSYDEDFGDIDPNSIVLQEMTKVAPIRSSKEESARNMRENIKMNDLTMSVSAPVLDDLSNEYRAPEKRAEDLLERDKLDADEKMVLKQRLYEDLGKRPGKFSNRASKNMEKKLLEAKQLKIAKKGFLISIIPVVLGIIGAVLSWFTMDWPHYEMFKYVAIFALVGSLLLLIKSNHAKMFGVIIMALTLLMYVGPGLILYAINEQMQASPDYVVHLVTAVIACAANIISIIILTKNEAVNIYYTTKFSKQ